MQFRSLVFPYLHLQVHTYGHPSVHTEGNGPVLLLQSNWRAAQVPPHPHPHPSGVPRRWFLSLTHPAHIPAQPYSPSPVLRAASPRDEQQRGPKRAASLQFCEKDNVLLQQWRNPSEGVRGRGYLQSYIAVVTVRGGEKAAIKADAMFSESDSCECQET